MLKQDEIIEMVRIAEDKVIANPNLDWKIEFAKLVAAAAASKEREACAMLAQKTVCDTHIPTGVKIYGTAVAKAIRARGKPASRGTET